MKKVFNLRIECNAPTFVMTDTEFCQALEEGMSDDFGEEMKYVKLKAEPCDKDQQLAIYKRALELACKDNKRAYDLQYLESDVLISNVEAFVGEYLRKAKEELEEQNGNQ